MREDCKPGPIIELNRGHWMRREPQFDTCADCGGWRRDHPFIFCTGINRGCEKFIERIDDNRKCHSSSIGTIYI